ncbi:hypothetical protein C823_000107 [Eubacterium plexicaudatum ASF492]|uniref:Uncharacterized protein n=1 Tax=Eubacterium plexicaudatum ASF492 TaxID=1235802 RepID=N2AK04_9FIRM|nr:hypothetical protein C823_000107 [Eubacterium plexicaudatum ASF492]
MDIKYLLILQNIREAFGGVFDSYMLKITSFAETFPAFLLLSGIYWCAGGWVSVWDGIRLWHVHGASF